MSDERRQARIAGALYTIVAVTAPIGLMWVPGRLIVDHDATATADRIAGNLPLLHLGMASELFHQAIEVWLVLVLYHLFKPVGVKLARQMLVLGLIPIPLVFLNVLNEVAAATAATRTDWLSAFGKPQLDALAYLFVHLHAQGLQIASVFWGLWLWPFGLLALRCGFIPKVFGWLVLAAGTGYVLGAIANVLAPGLADAAVMPTFLLELGEPAMILWLLLAGARAKPLATPTTSPA